MPDHRIFVDTNTLLYLHDKAAGRKSAVARDWLETLGARGQARTNLQILNELTHVLLRKQWFDNVNVVHAIVDNFAAFGNDPLSWNETVRARELHARYGYSWWDCLLLASALELGCGIFLSEDLHDGQTIDRMTIVNPFAHDPEQILSSR